MREINVVTGGSAAVYSMMTNSVRSLNLRNLLILHFAMFDDQKNGLARSLRKRMHQQKIFETRANAAYELSVDDVQVVLGCSRRTAYDYRQTIRILYGH